MTEKRPIPPSQKNDAKALAVERRKILSLPPEKALEAVAEHPLPVSLVQSFGEEDLYMLVHTIGPDDALPLLSLASNQQWEYLLDMDAWQRDRLDPGALTEWYDRLLKADPDRFTHWISQEKSEELEYYIFRNMEIVRREHDQDASEIGDDFFTEDQIHYLRLRPYPYEAKAKQEIRDHLVPDLLKRIAVYDFPRYTDLLTHATVMIPAEAEEEFYRLRAMRLAEKGLLPYHEAVGIYQPLTVGELLARERKPRDVGGRPMESLPLAIETTAAEAGASLFVRTLSRIDDLDLLHRLQAELAGLCNQVIAADQLKNREREVLKQVVKKVGDYITIGMEKIVADLPDENPYRAANLIRDYLLGDLFRVGYGCALTLKHRADRWRRGAWFTSVGQPLAFWGETGMGVLGGLLLKKPLYFDNYATGTLYREFITLEDISRTEEALTQIIAFDNLLSLLSIQVRPMGHGGLLTYKNLLLTLWAGHYLKIAANPAFPSPLTLDQFHILFRKLWQPKKKPRRIKEEIKTDFLHWLSGRSGLTAYEIGERLGQGLTRLFAEIETELGQVEEKNIDPRFIKLFLFEMPQEEGR
jgi:hypothetical protein